MEGIAHIAIYFAAISLLAIILTVHDKRAAQQRKWRVRESTLDCVVTEDSLNIGEAVPRKLEETLL